MGTWSIPPAVLWEAHVAERPEFYRNSAIKVDLSTDDWPFLYMPRRVYPALLSGRARLILLLTFDCMRASSANDPSSHIFPSFFWVPGSCS